MDEMKRIVDLLDRAGGGDAWHGPSVDATLAGVTTAQAAARPIIDGHSIWELALHIAVWERAVARRFAGERFDPTAEEDWSPPEVEMADRTYAVIGVIPRASGKDASSGNRATKAADDAWARTVADVRTARSELRAAMLAFDSHRLDTTVQGKNYSFYVMAHGIVQHDLYHAGQIALLKKAPA